jgi:hypothetical protein
MQTVAFSVRLPTSLLEKIEAQAKLHRRSRNAEIQVMLEDQLIEMLQEDFRAVIRPS